MSLHALADQMAARGRNSDSMLVHMAPQEVAGLQALALKHGGSLTINPDTGLPEANFLKKLLPMIAGFALGPAGFGLMSAAGAGMTVGAVTGLATGSLSKGLMAGLGAYGGAGLGEAFMGAGTNAMTTAGMANYGDTLAAQGLEAGTAAYGDAASKLALESQKQAMASPFMDRAAAGFGAITKNPAAFGNFAKQNAGSLLAATSPLLADQGVETVTKLDNPGYIRNFDYDPMTQTARALNPVRVRDLGYAGGGEIGAPRTVTQMPGTSPYRDSQAAYEYLMGIAPKEPQQNTQTQTQTSINPAAEGRYSWDSDKKAYTFIPANGVTETMPTPAPALNYEFGGGDSGSGVGGGSGGVGGAGGPASTSAADPADMGAVSDDGDDGDGDDGDGDDGDGDGNKNGGLMHLHKKFAEGGATNIRDGSSQAAYNYLMGLTNSTRPDAPATPEPQSVYTPQPITPTTPAATTTPIIPPAPTTRGITALPTTAPSPLDNFRTTTPVMRDPDDFRTTTPVMRDLDDFRTAATAMPELNNFSTAATAMPELNNFRTATNIDNANIAVDVPNNGVTSMGNGVTQVTMDQIAQQQPALQEAVQYEPNGGAMVTMPEVVFPAQDTFNPNTSTYVDVGNAGGDFGNFGNQNYYGDALANGGMAYAMGGGLGSLGGYSDGGRLLRGPGDGVSDSIPAMIGKKQPARLADGEFVVPARIVSELGNGSTEAGARKLYKMMDRIQAARGKTVGKGRVAKNSRAEKYLPA